MTQGSHEVAFINITHPTQLRPFDMLGEGRVVSEIIFRPEAVTLVVANCSMVEEEGLKRPNWGELHEEPYPVGPFKVARDWMSAFPIQVIDR